MDAALPPSSILIVDDEPANLLTLEAVLEPLGQTIVPARSGEEAIALAETREFAVILLDVRLPGIDGVEAAAAIKKRDAAKFTPIIFITADRSDGVLAKSYRYGAVDYVVKPYDPEILRSKVAIFVELFERGQRIKQKEARLRQREREDVERESREKVRRVEDRLRAVVTHAPIILFSIDRDGRFTLSEGSGLAELGLRPGELVGSSVDERYPGAMAEQARRALAGEEFSARVRHEPSGIVHETMWIPIWNAEGHVREVIGISNDVSERARAEEERRLLLARESDQRLWLETILNLTPTPLLLIDRETADVVFANGAADAMAGGAFPRDPDDPRNAAYHFADASGLRVPLAELPGVRSRAVDPPPSRSTDPSSPRADGEEIFWRSPSGERTLVAYAAAVPAIANQKALAVVSFVDVTKLKRIEDELGAAVRARDDFLSIASHELNTPLTPLKMHVGRLQRRVGAFRGGAFVPGRGMDPESLARGLDLADRQIDRVTKLVGELLDVSRITAGQIRLEPERIDLRAVVDDVVGRFAEDAGRGGGPFAVTGDREIVGHWDKMRVEQVVTNLVSNAVKYGAGKPVDVIVRAVGEGTARAELVVRDRGIGIPKEQQARIFDRFERAVSIRHYGGFGLGLWIVRQIVEASGGTVRVESVVDAGSTFTVTLPILSDVSVRVAK